MMQSINRYPIFAGALKDIGEGYIKSVTYNSSGRHIAAGEAVSRPFLLSASTGA
jgi:hypothetical protein